ncbi:MAG: 50S ribosomal protein L13 [Bacillota bacterium]|nr:50S ribosomal protein L13 [Bacillota bacterium]
MSTYTAKPQDINRKWFVVDADGKVLGRLASEVAKVLRGKHKPIFTPHMDTGDFVIVVNAERVMVTGNKAKDKLYFRHSNYPGGLRKTTFETLIKTHPERAVEAAVKGMLPHNRLGRKLYRKLKVYRGPVHPHQAQRPEALVIEE